MQYFGEKGLTSTSANYIANKAKEYYESLEKKLKYVSFTNIDICLITSDTKIPKRRGLRDLSVITETLEEISQCKALIAWLREAIKAKEALHNEAQGYVLPEYEAILAQRPYRVGEITMEEAINSLSIGERMKYLSLEAEAATIGKYIHPAGPLSDARRIAYTIDADPVTCKEDGANTIIYYNSLSISLKEMDDMFFKLQEKHRSVQAELNGMKHALEVKIREDALRKGAEYEEAYEKWDSEKTILYSKQFDARKLKSAEVEQMKIIIPNNLEEIYTKISNM